jgi:uncharacterized protein (DUF111 family)
MLLGALIGAGAPLREMNAALAALAAPAAPARPGPGRSPAPTAPPRVHLSTSAVTRAGLLATRAHVRSDETEPPRRTWADIRELLAAAPLADGVRRRSLATFAALAAAEATVHGIPAAEVHFHEVGALDAIADVVGVCAGIEALGLAGLVVSPIALGGGSVRAAHGVLPVPGPAVLELLRAGGLAGHGGGIEHELCTPTGAALVVANATGQGELPLMTITAVGVGAGRRERPDRPNVARLVIGEGVPIPASAGSSPVPAPAEPAAFSGHAHPDDPVRQSAQIEGSRPASAEPASGEPSSGEPVCAEPASAESVSAESVSAESASAESASAEPASGGPASARDPACAVDPAGPADRPRVADPARQPVPSAAELLLECNIDDLDPRLWPEILAVLLAAGARDAWLTPMLMKKGRPAHTLSVLVGPSEADAVREAVFTHTSTLGLREMPVVKRVLDRRFHSVVVDGQEIAVKVGSLPDGRVTTVQPEWEDVRRAAAALGRPARVVLAEAMSEIDK